MAAASIAFGADPEQADSAPDDVKFASPAACLEAFSERRKDKDPSAVLPCYTEAMVNRTVGDTAFELEQTLSQSGEKGSAAIQTVLKKHGLAGRDLAGFLKLVDSPTPGGAGIGLMQIGASVKDKVLFLREAAAAKAESQPASALTLVKQADDELANRPAMTISDVKINGDSAEGMVPFPELGLRLPMYFKRQGGSWRMALGQDEPDWTKPIQGRFLFQEYKK
jgi:hypothetical protein